MAKKITSIPGASRTVHALRDIGYDLNSAVCDLLDNSISQGKAKNIYINFIKQENEFKICISDDGCGMDSDTLEEAMRLGSDVSYTRTDLSKYGMGMKTASFSQAQKMTVLSKMKNCYRTGYMWDIDHVDQTDKWEIHKLNATEIRNKIKNSGLISTKSTSKLFNKHSWTTVVWEGLVDFQINYDSYKSEYTATNYYIRVIDRLSNYVSLVFHRFITGENRARKTNIFINNKLLKALDPFCRSEKNTKKLILKGNNGKFKMGDLKEPVVINRYILPTIPSKGGKYKFSSEKVWKRARGTKSWNDSQGYYVYRNNRLISWGGWFSTKQKDEHDKLARASIDLTADHDKLFTIDVKKTRVKFPEQLRNHLKINVNKSFTKEAKKRYGGDKKKMQRSRSAQNNLKRYGKHFTDQIALDGITVTEHRNRKEILITNVNGEKVSKKNKNQIINQEEKIIFEAFGKPDMLWQMRVNPDSKFQVYINTDHPMYELIYEKYAENDQLIAVVDAFLLTMSYVQLKCITNNNEVLFNQIRSVISDNLHILIDKKILK